MDTVSIKLKESWKFHYGDEPEGWYKGYDDSAWEKVVIPHDWSVHMPFDRKNSSGTGYLSGGTGWYRCHFTLPKEWQGKHISVVFDGVYKNSQVWCNSYNLGKRPYGYTQFDYDISDFVHFGEEENVISVRVVHEDIADSRWFTGSGIYRNVYIKAEEKLHMVHNGINIVTLEADSESAEVLIDSEITNENDTCQEAAVISTIYDSEGIKVSDTEKRLIFNPGETLKCSMHAKIKEPRRWMDCTPYLYTFVLEIEVRGKKYIIDKRKGGIRTVKFDADKGLFVNGENVKLKGVCVHHDGGCLGAAMYKEVWERRLLILKNAGCNAIRTSHNPHMPELYDLCDEIGFYMMDEAFDEWENPKNKWSTGHNVYPPKHQGYAEDFSVWHEKDLRTMIRRDRCHPSIIMWSIGNEIDYPNDPYCHPSFAAMTGNNDANKPARERMYDPDKPDASRLPVIAKKLADIVRSEDWSRPVTLAAAYPELSSNIGFFDSLDVVGYNYKEQYYEQDHKRFPDKPFLGSENGHGYRQWLYVKDNDYISGQFLWTGIDYLGEAKGWPVHASGAGLITLAGFPKPGYYKRKTFWDIEPAVYVFTGLKNDDNGEWKDVQPCWDYDTGDIVTVRCFTNLDRVSLYINDKLVGTKDTLNEYGCFEWEAEYEPGELKAVAVSDSFNIVREYSLNTPGKTTAVSAGKWNIVFCEESEVDQIEIMLKDENENLVLNDDRLVNISVISGGTLLGIENGDISDLTPYTSCERRTYKGRMLVYILKDNTPLSLKIAPEGLPELVFNK